MLRGATWRRWRPEAVLALLTVVLAWPTVCYPFGRDLGLYFYVGREWALRGRIPYRDVFDHKTPGIYLVHYLLVRLFGEELWAIRLAEVVAIFAIGWLAHVAMKEKEENSRPGLASLVTLSTAAFYFVTFDFKATGEGEIWCALLLVAAAATLARVDRLVVAAALAGVLFGCAILVKPSALWFAPALVYQAHAVGVARFRWARATMVTTALRLVVCGLGMALPIAATLAYFATHSALRDAYEVVVRANTAYVQLESAIKLRRDYVWNVWGFVDATQPLSLLAFTGLGAVLFRNCRDAKKRRGGVLALLFLVCAAGSVASQQKFFMGHWTISVGSFALLAAACLRGMTEWRPDIKLWRLALAATLPHFMSGAHLQAYLHTYAVTVHYARGAINRPTFTGEFVEHAVATTAAENEEVASVIVRYSSPDDAVLVRGFQPQIYARAKRRWSGRFFWSIFLVSPTRPYNQEKWRAEDAADIERTPPRVVATIRSANRFESPLPWLERGYTVVHETKDVAVLVAPGVPIQTEAAH